MAILLFSCFLLVCAEISIHLSHPPWRTDRLHLRDYIFLRRHNMVIRSSYPPCRWGDLSSNQFFDYLVWKWKVRRTRMQEVITYSWLPFISLQPEKKKGGNACLTVHWILPIHYLRDSRSVTSWMYRGLKKRLQGSPRNQNLSRQ